MSSKSRASAMYGVRRWLQPRNRTSSPDGGLDHDARSCFSRGESHLSRLRQMFGPSLCGIALQNTRGIPLSRYRSWYRSSSRPYGLAPLEQKASQDIQPVQRSSTSPTCSPAASALTIPGASSWSARTTGHLLRHSPQSSHRSREYGWKGMALLFVIALIVRGRLDCGILPFPVEALSALQTEAYYESSPALLLWR